MFDTDTLATALVADDEPHLAAALVRRLQEAWPLLKVVATANDGIDAVSMALDLLPDVIFLDIRMPGRDGLAAAEAITDDWPIERHRPLLVFVTAFGEFALQAFEREALDYILKPVTPERIAVVAERLQRRLAERAPSAEPGETAKLLHSLQTLPMVAQPTAPRLQCIRASVGHAVRLIQVSDILCVEAADKYVNIVTANAEALIRSSLRDFLDRIETADFTQIHRGAVVNLRHVELAERDEAGNYHLVVRGLARRLRVSRAFAHQFRPMQFG